MPPNHIPHGVPSHSRTLLLVASLVALGMTGYEWLKQAVNPDITVWESHVITILISTAVATLSAHLVLRQKEGLIVALMAREAESERLRGDLAGTVARLQQSLAEVKTLSGLLPICASCKSIRDDQGYWNHLETYIAARSEVDFSHGTCPPCSRKLYPNLFPATENG